MLHLLPLHPDAQEQALGPTHLPLFMHIGSHTPGARGERSGLKGGSCPWTQVSVRTHSSDTSCPCSPRDTSTRRSSCTDLRSYREGCTRLGTQWWNTSGATYIRRVTAHRTSHLCAVCHTSGSREKASPIFQSDWIRREKPRRGINQPCAPHLFKEPSVLARLYRKVTTFL